MSNLNDPVYWRERADQARQMAKSFAYEPACRQMMGLAEGYEQMARMAEEMKLTIKDGVSPFGSRSSVNGSARSDAAKRSDASAYPHASLDRSLATARR